MISITYLTAALSLLSVMTLEADARSRHGICRPSRHRSKAQPPVQAPVSGSNVTAAGIAAANNKGKGQPKQLFRIADYWGGKNFFDGWDFWDQGDPTHGAVNFLGKSDAFKSGLAYIDDDGAAIMRVDNSTHLNEGQNRNSIRIQSQNTYNGGLFVLDVQNMPHGCAVWPAFWTVGPDWPAGGEIDILEGVHDADVNQMTLHTADGCSLGTQGQNGVQNAVFTGKVVNTVCASSGSNNAGCAVIDASQSSYGKALNAAAGGVFAMLWNDDGIKIWRFERDSVPDDLTNQNPNPASWPDPKAAFVASACSPKKFFKDHSIVFDTTLCGDWAGATYQSAGCPGTCSQAVANPSNFDNAYWRVNSVIVYQTNN